MTREDQQIEWALTKWALAEVDDEDIYDPTSPAFIPDVDAMGMTSLDSWLTDEPNASDQPTSGA